MANRHKTIAMIVSFRHGLLLIPHVDSNLVTSALLDDNLDLGGRFLLSRGLALSGALLLGLLLLGILFLGLLLLLDALLGAAGGGASGLALGGGNGSSLGRGVTGGAGSGSASGILITTLTGRGLAAGVHQAAELSEDIVRVGSRRVGIGVSAMEGEPVGIDLCPGEDGISIEKR